MKALFTPCIINLQNSLLQVIVLASSTGYFQRRYCPSMATSQCGWKTPLYPEAVLLGMPIAGRKGGDDSGGWLPVLLVLFRGALMQHKMSPSDTRWTSSLILLYSC